MRPGDRDLNDAEPAAAADGQPTRSSYYDEAGGVSKLFLTWLNPVILLSSQKTLELADLGPLSVRFAAKHLSNSLFHSAGPPSFSSIDSLGKLTRSLFTAFGIEFMWSGLLKFLGDCATLASPLLLKLLLGLVQIRHESPNSPSLHDWQTAIGLAVGIFLLQSANTIAVNLYFQRTFQCGFRVRLSLLNAVYRKALRLSLNSRKDFGPARILNLTSVDCARVDQAVSFLHYIWSGPFQCLVIVVMLQRLLGWTAFVGLALFVLSFPIQGRIVSAISRQRKRISQFTDQRLKVMSELVSGIKIIKTHAWEGEVERRVAEIRKLELQNIRRIQRLQAAMSTITWLVPVMACIGTFLLYRHVHGELPIDLVLPALAYFNLLRLPLFLIPAVVGFATDARVALGRVAELMASEEKVDYLEDIAQGGPAVEMAKAEFSWNTDFRLLVEQLTIDHGELVCIVGSIGAGKTSLLQAILGEIYKHKGTVRVQKSLKIAYCPQTAWIISGTIRDNVLFGQAFDDVLYDKVLNVCQLKTDLQLFPSHDLTLIGERGINLSGGQKQRLSLARAVYSQADIFILDDPLSALDARVANAVWSECVCGHLGGKTRIIVTHSHRHIAGNRTITLEGGQVVLDRQTASHAGSPLQPDAPPEPAAVDSTKPTVLEKQGDEDRAVGDISRHVVLRYCDYFGGPVFIAVVVLTGVANQMAKVGSDIWLSSQGSMAQITETRFATVYGLCGLLQGLLVSGVCLLFDWGAVTAASKLHNSALQGLLRAPLSFFEQTSSGRILNRFSRDVDAADNQLSECLRSVMITFIQVLSALVLTTTLSWPAILIIVPAMFMFHRVQLLFRPPAREIKRLDALSKAPVSGLISESLAGALTIRAFKEEGRFVDLLHQTIDANSAPVFISLSLQRWVALRLEGIGNLIILAASLFAYVTAPLFAFTGLAIVYVLNITGSLSWLIRRFSEGETLMVACERLLYYSEELPGEQEPAVAADVPAGWPDQGAISIADLSVAYRPDRPPVLRNVTLAISPGEHIGIVGRTGAGKSTVISAFFRLYPMSSTGGIFIDGIDIASVPLPTLRKRLSIIPQDPVLFSGSIRSNLDPFSKHADNALWLALQRSGLAKILQRNPAGLDAVIDAHGENWSAGERQLLCLARALLAESRIILMDEATSSVDPSTDAMIQECIARDLRGATVLIVAHRLNTIMHCERVVVLEAGQVVEEGPPQDLARSGGPFSLLLKQQQAHI